jgi:translocation and assembly module TamB
VNKARAVVGRILRVALWGTLVLLFLLVLVIALLQIPAIQNKIADSATSFVSSRTNTKVEIDNISISFPGTIVLKGLFVEDQQHDTLLYAGEARVNMAFRDLLKNRIHISSFLLEEAIINLNRREGDSLYNFHFLLTAFGDTTQTIDSEEKKSSWAFAIDRIGLKNIRFHFDDGYMGTFAAASAKQLNLKMDEIDLAQLIFNIDELFVEGFDAHVLITETEVLPQDKSESALPTITANKIQINDANVSYGDSIIKQSALFVINQLDLELAALNLEEQSITLDKVSLSDSEVAYFTSERDQSLGTKDTSDLAAEEASNWSVSVEHVHLKDNSLTYKVANKPLLGNAFDVHHMEYTNVTLDATDLYYSAQKTTITINEFTAVDQNNFSILSFETRFSMDPHSITLNKLKLNTPGSFLDADLSMHFSSLSSLKDSLPFMKMELEMRTVRVRTDDILYFNRELENQEFFQHARNITSMSGSVAGSLNRLTGRNLVVKTGTITTLETDFIIVGLADAKTAVFNFPDLKIRSGKSDIDLMAGSYVPESIEIPETISMEVVFNGRIKDFESTIGLTSSFGSAQLAATLDENEHFSSTAAVDGFNLGLLLKDTLMYGPVSFVAEANGAGLDINTVKAEIHAEVSQIYLNQYNYQKLDIDGVVSGREFAGKIQLDDEYAAFDFDGKVNFNPGQEQYVFLLNVEGANLQQLNFSKEDIRIGFVASAELSGSDFHTLHGLAGITNITVVKDGDIFVLDSLMLASINEPGKSEMVLNSAVIGINYTGTVSPASIKGELMNHLNRFFPFSDSSSLPAGGEPSNFSFEIQLHNHPILSKVLLPQLKEFEPGIISGSFDSDSSAVKLTATMDKIVYGNTEILDLEVDVDSDAGELTYNIFSGAVSNALFRLENFRFDGRLAEDTLFTRLSSVEDDNRKKIAVHSHITKDADKYSLAFDPDEMYLMYDQWNVDADNHIQFGEEGFKIHKMFLDNGFSTINITSVNDRFNDDLSIEIKNFNLEDISRVMEMDTTFVSGMVDGNVLLKRVNEGYGIIADAVLSELILRGTPIGDVFFRAANPVSGKFDIDVRLTGSENNLTAKGYYIADGAPPTVSINADIQSLAMKTIEAFSMGQITETSGTLAGKLVIQGVANAPEITGELVFSDAFLTPAALNHRLELSNETVYFKPDGIYFNAFTLKDADQQTAILDGAVQMKQFKDFIFSLTLVTKDFLLFNTTSKNNDFFFGRMVIDSEINIRGPLALPTVDGRLRMKEGSNFTFAVPEDKLTTDRGENVVQFTGALQLHPILGRGADGNIQSTEFRGIDISTIIEVDKEATLRLLMDPSSNDSLVVKGEAALSFALDRSGKMSLTGAYNLEEGSYLVSLESLVRRRFDIVPGSTIIWNGDPLDANISINAQYEVRAAPYDLVAGQMSGMADAESSSYKQRYPFWVLLKLRGEMLQPVIEFEIQLPPEDRGILGGAVNQKLIMLNEDPSELNKQVFALLVLGRFVQENPLHTESGGTSTLLRSTVSNFLSSQLNRWSSRYVPGVELNFDIQSYSDYQSGEAEGRTQLELGLKKQLFNERLSVEVGGSLDVEGEMAKQNNASDFTSDVTVEYKLTEDGRFRLKAFRHNQYEGAIDGLLVETGAGVVFVRNFNAWRELFSRPQPEDE